MISKQGRTLQGVALSQGNAFKTTGIFLDATTFHCNLDGSVKVTYLDGKDETYTVVKGEAFPINGAKQIEIVTGTFSIGYD